MNEMLARNKSDALLYNSLEEQIVRFEGLSRTIIPKKVFHGILFDLVQHSKCIIGTNQRGLDGPSKREKERCERY